MSLVKKARNILLKTIAYKFAVRNQISLRALIGMEGGAHKAAKELSKAIADLCTIGEVEKRNLEKALVEARFF